jgi:DNA-binding response OmpR family regulator
VAGGRLPKTAGNLHGCRFIFSIEFDVYFYFMAKILVGEDDDSIRDVFRIYLYMQQHQVALAASKDEILEQANEFSPEVVLLDVMLNGEDGREICQHLKVAGSNTKVILLSAYTDYLQNYEQWKADAALPKPFDLNDLNRTIQKVLDQSATG